MCTFLFLIVIVRRIVISIVLVLVLVLVYEKVGVYDQPGLTKKAVI